MQPRLPGRPHRAPEAIQSPPPDRGVRARNPRTRGACPRRRRPYPSGVRIAPKPMPSRIAVSLRLAPSGWCGTPPESRARSETRWRRRDEPDRPEHRPPSTGVDVRFRNRWIVGAREAIGRTSPGSSSRYRGERVLSFELSGDTGVLASALMALLAPGSGCVTGLSTAKAVGFDVTDHRMAPTTTSSSTRCPRRSARALSALTRGDAYRAERDGGPARPDRREPGLGQSVDRGLRPAQGRAHQKDPPAIGEGVGGDRADTVEDCTTVHAAVQAARLAVPGEAFGAEGTRAGCSRSGRSPGRSTLRTGRPGGRRPGAVPCQVEAAGGQ